MNSYIAAAIIYLVGGLTVPPLIGVLFLLYAYLTLPTHLFPLNRNDQLPQPGDDEEVIKSGTTKLAEKSTSRNQDADVAAGYFAVCREYVPGGVNGKPPERTTPAGTVVAGESPSVYQSMYRSIFDRNKTPTIDQGKNTKRARNVFYVVLRHGHLMLYDDAEQLEVRHVISLAHHDVGIYGGGEDIPDGELWIRRNAICLTRRPAKVGTSGILPTSKPFYLFSENCSDKEDFYFALLHNQRGETSSEEHPPPPQRFDVKDVVSLVQRLHSSEEHLQTRWFNAVVGRLFLALYKTPEIEHLIRTKITKKIVRVKKPAFLSAIAIQKIDMGEAPPYITNPRLKDLTVEGECSVEADVYYSGNFRLEVAAKARIELGSRFKAREVDLVLAVLVKKLEGHVVARFKPPPSNRIWFTFESMPRMEMCIEPIVSSRQITYNIILRAIESRIREVIAETVVSPNWDDIPFTDTSHQLFRGGIWAEKKSTDAPAESKSGLGDATNIQDQEEQASECTDDGNSGNADLISNEKSSDALAIPATPLSTGSSKKSPHSAGLSSEEADKVLRFSSPASDSKQLLGRPRSLRSGSYSSAAIPVVSTDIINVDAIKDARRDEYYDAASRMIAITRSQNTSPTESPVGSPTHSIDSHGKSGTDSPASLKRSSLPESSSAQAAVESSLASSVSSTPPTTSINSSKGLQGFDNNLKPLSTTATIGKSPNESTTKKSSLASLGSATVSAAKKWGWGSSTKDNGRDVNGNRSEETHKAGTPSKPMGRGRPLPPPGTPLPFPEKNSSKLSIASMPQRKPLPPRTPLQRQNTNSTPDTTSVQSVSSFGTGPQPNHDGDDVLVVAAPPEPQSSTTVADKQDELVSPFVIEDVASEATTEDRLTEHEGSSISEDKYGRQSSADDRQKASALPESDNGHLSSRLTAQENEVRSRSKRTATESEHL